METLMVDDVRPVVFEKKDDGTVAGSVDLSDVRYTKPALVGSSWFIGYSELLDAILDDEELYTRAETEQAVKTALLDEKPKRGRKPKV
jgi:hypothetical protein